MEKTAKKITIFILKLYKLTVSGYLYLILGGGCKYQKTCSEFAIEAVNKKGVFKGLRMSLRRFSSCRPFSRNYYATLSDFD